jgi:glycosyltransferase involved in cell wall biosynthesis
MNEFDLTIIVPIYNVESYIQRCLESVIAQESDGLRIECLLIDDCSPDKSMEVVQTVLDGYHGTISFTVLHHEHNRGLSAARNTGIKAAKGDYVFFLDSDDWLTPQSLAKMFAVLSDYPNCPLVIGQYVQDLRTLPTYEKTGLLTDTQEIKQLFLEEKIPFYAWNKLVKRSLLVEHSVFFVEGTIFEDLWWSFRVFNLVDSVYLLPETVYVYEINPSSIMGTRLKNGELSINSYVFTFNNMLDHPYDGLSVNQYFFIFRHIIRAMDIYIHCKLPKGIKKDFYALRCRLMKQVYHDGPIILTLYFLLMFSPFYYIFKFAFFRRRFDGLFRLMLRIAK